MKKFILGSLKVAAGLTIFYIVCSIFYGIYTGVIYLKNKDLKAARNWKHLPLGNAKFNLKTKWADDQTFYQLTFHCPKQDSEGIEINKGATFRFSFFDSEGFKIRETESLLLHYNFTESDPAESILEAQGQIWMKAEDYRKAARWEISGT